MPFSSHEEYFESVSLEVRPVLASIHELAPYRGEKGNLSFRLDRPLPLELIGRVAIALYHEYGHK